MHRSTESFHSLARELKVRKLKLEWDCLTKTSVQNQDQTLKTKNKSCSIKILLLQTYTNKYIFYWANKIMMITMMMMKKNVLSICFSTVKTFHLNSHT